MTKQYDIYDQQGYKVGEAQERGAGWADIYVPGNSQPVGGIRGQLRANRYDIKEHADGIPIGEVRERRDSFDTFVENNNELVGMLVLIGLGIAGVVAAIWAVVWLLTTAFSLTIAGITLVFATISAQLSSLFSETIFTVILAGILGLAIGYGIQTRRLAILNALLGAGAGWFTASALPFETSHPFLFLSALVLMVGFALFLKMAFTIASD